MSLLIKYLAKAAAAALIGGGAVSLTKHGVENIKNVSAQKQK